MEKNISSIFKISHFEKSTLHLTEKRTKDRFSKIFSKTNRVLEKISYSNVFKIWYINMCGCVLNEPILFDHVDSAINRVSAVIHKGVIV
jgi:hypothetical protein